MSAFCFYQILFWIPVGLLFYSYIIYPLLLELIYLVKKKNLPPTVSGLPSVSILLSVYNEEKVIEEKIKNLLECDYPNDKLEIIIGNDCSDDKTEAILQQIFDDNNLKLKTRNFETRRGKPSVLNDLVKDANGDIILLTDANILFEKEAIRKLVTHFTDSKIGLVGGNIINKASGLGISNQEKTYISRENRIKYLEGKNFGGMIGPFGGFYALRKNLFKPVPENFLVDDFYICMNVLQQNFKSISEPTAIAYEEVSEDWKQEYRRKARISAGNFQNLLHFENLLLRFDGAAFCFFSHKVLRWFGPFFIIFSLFLNIIVVLFGGNYFYQFIMWIQILFILSPATEWINFKIGRANSTRKFIAYFYTMNFALVMGWFRFIKGIKSGAWTPTKR